MIMSTIKRAKEIVKKGEVKIINSIPPYYYNFQVKQRNGNWADVWYENKNGQMEWNCNTSTKKKNGGTWGCVMNNKADKTKPYCSHTLACFIILHQRRNK